MLCREPLGTPGTSTAGMLLPVRVGACLVSLPLGQTPSIVPVIPLWKVHTNSVVPSGTVKVAVATAPASIVPVLRPAASIAKSWARSSALVIPMVTSSPAGSSRVAGVKRSPSTASILAASHVADGIGAVAARGQRHSQRGHRDDGAQCPSGQPGRRLTFGLASCGPCLLRHYRSLLACARPARCWQLVQAARVGWWSCFVAHPAGVWSSPGGRPVRRV